MVTADDAKFIVVLKLAQKDENFGKSLDRLGKMSIWELKGVWNQVFPDTKFPLEGANDE